MNADHPAHVAGKRSRDAVAARDKEAWLANFADDAIDTFQCGDEEANTGNITLTRGGHQIVTEGVFTYRANDKGELAALRAYWELDRAAATARKI